MPDWDEPTAPSFVFLQSCLALTEEKAQPLLRRGAVGVVGSPVRTYSASGGACSLAFFDALLYDDQSLGGGLRQAKNFLLAYALLKEKRLGKDAKRTRRQRAGGLGLHPVGRSDADAAAAGAAGRRPGGGPARGARQHDHR